MLNEWGMSHNDIARVMGVSRPTVSFWFSRGVPKTAAKAVAHIYKWAKPIQDAHSTKVRAVMESAGKDPDQAKLCAFRTIDGKLLKFEVQDFTPAMIHQVRQAYGMTQAEFGDIIGVSSKTMMWLENGRSKPNRLMSIGLSAAKNALEQTESHSVQPENAPVSEQGGTVQ